MNTITIATTTSRNQVNVEDMDTTLAQICAGAEVNLDGMTVVFNGTAVSVPDMTRGLDALYEDGVLDIKTDEEQGNNMLVVVPAMKAGC